MRADLRDFSSLPDDGFVGVVAAGVTVVVVMFPDEGKPKDIVVLLHGVWRKGLRELLCVQKNL